MMLSEAFRKPSASNDAPASIDSFLKSLDALKATLATHENGLINGVESDWDSASISSEDLFDDVYDDSDLTPPLEPSSTKWQESIPIKDDSYADAFAGGSATAQSYDRDWLLLQCELHIMENRGGDTSITPQQLCIDIFSLLRSDKSGDDIQNTLVDLIGYDNFELITTLLTNRTTIVQNIEQDGVANVLHKVTNNEQHETTPQMPMHGAHVTVQSKDEILEAKKARKDQRKAARHKDENEEASALLGFDVDNWREIREQQLVEASQRPLASGTRQTVFSEERYPHVYASHVGGNTLNAFGTKYVLPAGTERVEQSYYEEITIPASRKAAHFPGEQLVRIEQLDKLCQNTFKGYKNLNRVQSLVYPIAYETNENMLVCAPTGAGKTDVAMLTVLHTVRSYSAMDENDHMHLTDENFKIVYVAPMKALAAEVVQKFGKRLGWLGIKVRELTGDMQLTKAEINETHMIVTTPEKWDVVTRKNTGDSELATKVKLLIIDEVHLLHDDRGAVIESIVARTLRQVESTQNMIRICGLSATLPNYVDVAQFLRVNLHQGLFYFDGGFRPVPLEQHFIGVKGKANTAKSREHLDNATWEKVSELVRQDHQVMVFVHARKETVKTAQSLREQSLNAGMFDEFDASLHPKYGLYQKEVAKSRNKELRELFAQGFGIHHAGMLRSDRTLSERMFADGLLKVLCCTSTLAWGVNLPAYAVVIKGTQVYDTSKGSFVDLSILDVLQIFGRAGRPQYEDQGVGYICTTHDKLAHYVSAITQQQPIESHFIENLVDAMNAEISLGTVTNIDEAVAWLGYTYLYVRMRKNPLLYGMDHIQAAEDPLLGKRRHELITVAAKKLHQTQMIVFDERTGLMTPKDLGRIGSNYYIQHTSIEIFNQLMKPRMTEADVLAMISVSGEFDNIKVRDEESKELTKLMENGAPCQVKGGAENTYGKVNILLQSFISRAHVDDFALVSDSAYVSQNAGRIVRALFEIAMNRNWGPVTSVLLSISQSIDWRMWSFEHPLSQFGLPRDIMQKLENHPHVPSIEEMRDMTPAELGQLVRHVRMGPTIARCVEQFPMLQMEAKISPITRNVLRISVTVTPDFVWNDKVHGAVEPFWIWVEDSDNTEIYHSEYFILNKRTFNDSHKLGITIPVHEPLPAQIYIRAVSDKWIGSETVTPISFKHLILPELYPPHTDLLDLQPLPVSALQNEVLEEICLKRFAYFNPVQTQIFHTLYHTSWNALVGAPTGSGKTVAAELAMWAAFRDFPKSKVVYIAPMKALVRERVVDWRKRLTVPMNRKLIELTGDVTPDLKSIQEADIIITTPEKWDGISRSWQNRSYVTAVSLIIIDEIHLLGGDRGPILEVIVSRMNYIASQMERKVRIVGLSTALANAHDLADWLGIESVGLFNFRHSVRPVPLEIYIDGFPGKHYCPRMNSMNKPAFAAIKTHSPDKPVIIFVSSRRQTRLTAQDLIAYCGMEDNPRRFLNMCEDEFEMLSAQVHDNSLRMALSFGIGLHHAGLTEGDRKIVEELFANLKIQVLIATSTLAWGVNLPAHLVIIKGTEFYDAKVKGYVDFPITDVLQMMGRAGRPQFDNSGIARIFVHDVKKNFYKKFLHEPFPVESSLHEQLQDHFNAEISSGTIKSKQDAMDYLTWTYFFRRLHQNPTYYGLEDTSDEGICQHLSELIENCLKELEISGCVEIIDGFDVAPTVFGKIASYYYLSHRTMRLFEERIKPDSTTEQIIQLLTDGAEYDQLPVRHNEDLLNSELSTVVRYPVPNGAAMDSPHTKAYLLLQAHFSRLPLPITDYITDTNSVLDQSIRIAQAMIDVGTEFGYLSTVKKIIKVLQCIKQAKWDDEPSVSILTGVESIRFKGRQIQELRDLQALSLGEQKSALSRLDLVQREEALKVLSDLPKLQISTKIKVNKEFLLPSTMYDVEITLDRGSKPKGDGRIYSPRYPKPQYESYFCILTNEVSDEIIALKRVSLRRKTQTGTSEILLSKSSTTMRFETPEREGKHSFALWILNDGYIGLDQKVEVIADVRAGL